MIFHLILNSILVFIVLALAIEFFIFGFKIQNPRFRYCCRLLPLLKFPFDLIVFTVNGSSFFQNYNPFSCEFEALGYIQDLLSYDVTMTNHHPLLIPQYIANLFPSRVIDGFLVLAIFSSSIIFTLKLSQLIRSKLTFDHLLKGAKPISREIINVKLAKSLRAFNAKVLMSNEIHMAFAAGSKYILIPENFLQILTQEEYEAVIAHELEHLRWRDPLLRIFSNVLCATFWWIPASWFVRKLEQDQEEASDHTIYKYNIEPYAMGSALVKSIKHTKALKLKLAAICPLSSQKTHERRLLNLLQPQQTDNRLLNIIGALFCLSAFISFWAC